MDSVFKSICICPYDLQHLLQLMLSDKEEVVISCASLFPWMCSYIGTYSTSIPCCGDLGCVYAIQLLFIPRIYHFYYRPVIMRYGGGWGCKIDTL